jgi:hypothetical protein
MLSAAVAPGVHSNPDAAGAVLAARPTPAKPHLQREEADIWALAGCALQGGLDALAGLHGCLLVLAPLQLRLLIQTCLAQLL